MTTRKRLEMWLEMLKYVTPGPWSQESHYDGIEIRVDWRTDPNARRVARCYSTESWSQPSRDAEFICLMRNEFPALVRAHLELQAEYDAYVMDNDL